MSFFQPHRDDERPDFIVISEATRPEWLARISQEPLAPRNQVWMRISSNEPRYFSEQRAALGNLAGSAA